jgi:anti-sigma-K factor RskA
LHDKKVLDLKDYISSGILELYAAGALSEKEAAEVEAMAEEHPEVRAEISAIRDALDRYADMHRKNPRPMLRQEILDSIEDSDSTGGFTPISMQSEAESRKQSYNDANLSPKFSYLMAAVWAFLALNIIGNIYFYSRLKGTEEKMAIVLNENNKMRIEYEKVKEDMEKKSTDLKMVMNRSNKIVDMKGMDIAPASFATVYWNPNTKQVMLNVDNLPMPPSDKQYQLWALKDGKPIDAGVFDMKPGASGEMHMMPVTITDADAFAVTLENKGGSPVPTFTQLYVMGKI